MWCKIGIHDWNKWEECYRYYNTFGDWFKVHQQRTCKCCGKLQMRKFSTF